ncbi:DNA-directed RNA polymerase [Moraxella sp. ZY200743]|uniref:DNA-directed RNA polymerase n=1 Tax=Moraxella sp. ZY200743 TaxID=2911970 RepID=UPI003D7C4273
MFKQFNPKQYLAIDIANHYGLDKLNYEERINWVKAHYDTLENYQDKADEPILYAKAVNALRMADKGLAVGHTVAFDSASSGLQLMSLLTNCESGMRLTGLIDPDNRMDAYTMITKRINERLKDNPDIDMVSVSRSEAKKAIMVHLYGSKAVPEQVFGEALNVFYSVMDEMCHGASCLLSWLLKSWDENRDSYIWVMPDNHTVYIPVMVQKQTKLNVQANNTRFSISTIYYEQGCQETGLSNAANVVHSIDAYVLRSLVRRCNYDKDKVLKFKALNAQVPPTTVEQYHWVNDRYNATRIADMAMIYALDANTLPMINQACRDALNALCDHVLEYEAFEVVTVHDSFACHPNHVQRLRQQYNEILASLYESSILEDILSQLYQEDITIDVGEKIHAQAIRNSNYAIC